jgi:hypothetical protein
MMEHSVKHLIPLAFAFAALASTAEGRTVPEVQRFLKEEIVKLDAVAPPGPVRLDGDGRDGLGDYSLSLFRLRVQAEFGFDVGVAKVTLVPGAEFFWE